MPDDSPKALRTVLAMGHKFNDLANQCDCGVYWGNHQKDPQPCPTVRKKRGPTATHCKRGHSFAEHGHYSTRTKRCKLCAKMSNQGYIARRRDANGEKAATRKRWSIPSTDFVPIDEFKEVKKKKRY